jgi:hypothetical protein
MHGAKIKIKKKQLLWFIRKVLNTKSLKGLRIQRIQRKRYVCSYMA